MAEVKPPPYWMVQLNVALLRAGVGVGTQHLLSVRGRLSGEMRSTPVAVVTVDGARYVVAASSHAAWVGTCVRLAQVRWHADVLPSRYASSSCRSASADRSSEPSFSRFRVGSGSSRLPIPRRLSLRRIATRCFGSPRTEIKQVRADGAADPCFTHSGKPSVCQATAHASAGNGAMWSLVGPAPASVAALSPNWCYGPTTCAQPATRPSAFWPGRGSRSSPSSSSA